MMDIAYCKENIEWRLKDKGFEPGHYQAEWRDFGKGQEIEYNEADCMLAVLDALIHQGGVAAWAGDGTGCVTQMIEYAYERRDLWRTKAFELSKENERLKQINEAQQKIITGLQAEIYD